jgi:type I restriction enzyme S subunit
MTSASTDSGTWQQVTLQKIFEIRAAGDIDWSKWRREKDQRYPYPVYANGRANSGLHGYASYAVEAGNAVTLTARGTIGELGYAFFRAKSFTPIGRLLVLRPKQGVNALFYASYINSRVRFAQENTGVAQLTAPQISQVVLDLPPLPEQAKIAAVLNDVDALLNSLDRLIAKKRDLKQAAMQQLLTGQTRLPGFSGEWEVKQLGDIGEVSGSGVDKKSHPDETPVRLVNYMDVYRLGFIESGNLDHWVTAQTHHLRRCSVERGDVFFTPSSETRQDIANSSVAIEDIADAAYSYHVVRLRFKDNWDLKYSAYAFKTRDFLNQAEMICDGGGTRYVISLSKFRAMTLPVPPISEQEAIGKVLFDMDLEIKKLQGQREKTAAIKQGMMQELLTGRTRLV